jgi:mono/diheme cytochrome c family protein
VLVALTARQELGLVLVAGIFIVFALLSAMVVPRRWPDFPGSRGLKLFVAVTAVLVVAMLAAVAVFARESEEGEAEGGEAAAETRAAETETGAGAATGAETQPAGEAEGRGDAKAGAAVFAEQGCGGCHTLKEAGSDGSIGPNLDEAKPDYDLVVDRVTNGKGVMPAFGDELSEQEIRNVAAYVAQATGGS